VLSFLINSCPAHPLTKVGQLRKQLQMGKPYESPLYCIRHDNRNGFARDRFALSTGKNDCIICVLIQTKLNEKQYFNDNELTMKRYSSGYRKRPLHFSKGVLTFCSQGRKGLYTFQKTVTRFDLSPCTVSDFLCLWGKRTRSAV